MPPGNKTEAKVKAFCLHCGGDHTVEDACLPDSPESPENKEGLGDFMVGDILPPLTS